MATSFTFEDDKELVQQARTYVDAGTRIAWANVAQRMQRTGHNAKSLQERLRTLKKAWGNDIRRFPPSFYAQVRRPRGRPPAVTRQLRLGAATPKRQRTDTGDPAPLRSSGIYLPAATIFADVPREMVVQGTNKNPHRYAGELMPCGISSLIRELGELGNSDIFLDIGAGVGNVVVQVALGTNVNKAIGIEVCCDLYEVGVAMMSKSTSSRRLYKRAQLICKDAVDLRIASTPPYADASVVYWNNLLFEPQVIEHLKDELASMFLLQKLVSTLNFCPRHRDGYPNTFCRAFKLVKAFDLPCSWKADLQHGLAFQAYGTSAREHLQSQQAAIQRHSVYRWQVNSLSRDAITSLRGMHATLAQTRPPLVAVQGHFRRFLE
ncbi:hypothetical protein PHPALM_28836 [Phytophthora palmivora]|uniref:Histone-lysine N-methyltransferase, H3 lysine-79 specific n=1 Tax=Phytophthora palmivora TaxID=4796 RepID=A0A2P4X922_9STRA|nr:hypothetical protein PHPALM_28836 [Phytophthora palmivora]